MTDLRTKGFPSESRTVEMPVKLRTFLAEFMLDKRTGKVSLNIKDGQIVNFRVDESHLA